MMSSEAPSLLINLLYAVRADNQQLIDEAISSIKSVVRSKTLENNKAIDHNLDNEKRHDDVMSSIGSLHDVVKHILHVFPSLASIAEEEGGCLPLHVASSLGDVNVVKEILDKVKCAQTSFSTFKLSRMEFNLIFFSFIC